jgi:hypothetical protein
MVIREVAEEQRMSFNTCQANLTEGFCTRNVSIKFIPQLLTAELKEHCISVAPDVLKRAEAEFIFKHCNFSP